MAANPGKLCWSNRIIANANVISSYTIADWQGSSYRCGEDCFYTQGCEGYQFTFTDLYTGEGTCTLFDMDANTVASRGLYTYSNIYVLDGNYCPEINASFNP